MMQPSTEEVVLQATATRQTLCKLHILITCQVEVRRLLHVQVFYKNPPDRCCCCDFVSAAAVGW